MLVTMTAGCSNARPVRPAQEASTGPALAARRTAFEHRVLLTGEVDAVSAAEMTVPRLSSGRVTIRWVETDGALVKAGQKLAELDSASFVASLKERALAVSQAEIELKRQEWQNALADSERELEVKRKRTVLRRAEIDADVPPGILPQRDYLLKQGALVKAQAEVDKAEEALAAQGRINTVDLKLKRLSLDKILREVKLAESAIQELTLRAPSDGTSIVGDHPWEGRKLQIGDDVNVGQVVVRMPDLDQIRIRAMLPDVDDGRITVGMPAQVVLDAYPDRVMAGRITEIGPAAREISERSRRRVFAVYVGIDNPREHADLRPGLSARVEVVTERLPDTIVVPRQALEWDTSPAVRLASGERKPLTLGPCNNDVCVTKAGIEPGAVVARAAP